MLIDSTPSHGTIKCLEGSQPANTTYVETFPYLRQTSSHMLSGPIA